jgi:hypothetical protein
MSLVDFKCLRQNAMVVSTELQKLPATFLTEVVGVGALDPTNYKPDVCG